MLSLSFSTLLPIDKFIFWRIDLLSPFIGLDITEGITCPSGSFIPQSNEFSFFWIFPVWQCKYSASVYSNCIEQIRKSNLCPFSRLGLCGIGTNFWHAMLVPPLVTSYIIYILLIFFFSPSVINRTASAVESSNPFFSFLKHPQDSWIN